MIGLLISFAAWCAMIATALAFAASLF